MGRIKREDYDESLFRPKMRNVLPFLKTDFISSDFKSTTFSIQSLIVDPDMELKHKNDYTQTWKLTGEILIVRFRTTVTQNTPRF